MSKFWAGDDDDNNNSDNVEDEDENEDDEEEGENEKDNEDVSSSTSKAPPKKKKEEDGDNEDEDNKDIDDEEEDEDESAEDVKGKKKLYIEESSEEDEERVIKSEKQKFIEALLDTSTNFKNCLESNKKLGDWTRISEEIVLLQSLLSKFKNQVRKGGFPGFLVKTIALVESTHADLVAKSKIDKEVAQKFNAANWRGVNVVGQRLKKFLDKEWKTQITEYREDPANKKYNEPTEENLKGKEKVKEEAKEGPKRGTREFWMKKPGEESSITRSKKKKKWIVHLN